MDLTKKIILISERYGAYVSSSNHSQTICDLFKNVMLKAYPYHKHEVSFEEFVRNCIDRPVDYLFEMSEKLEEKMIYINLLNNCFKDGSNKHFGVKYKGYWFFLTHSRNDFSLPLNKNDFYMVNKSDRQTFLTSYSNCNPNVLRTECAKIHTKVLDEYIKKFIK